MSPLEPAVRRALEATPIAHLATVLPDGAPHVTPVFVGTEGEHVVVFTGPGSRKARNLRRDARVALSVAPASDAFTPVVVRGRVARWLDGDDAWALVDRIAIAYTGHPYDRRLARVVALIEVEHQTVGVG
jgi:PPOX class probable F420-dependent enzyme